MPVEIRPLALTRPEFQALLDDSLADTQSMVRRLWKEWKNGGNRFDQPGEVLLGAWRDSALVGLCGLNRDPYGGRAEVGRVRHLYVHRNHRRGGIGRALVRQIIQIARPEFALLELRTISPVAAAFYRRIGFVEVSRVFATHELALTTAAQ